MDVTDRSTIAALADDSVPAVETAATNAGSLPSQATSERPVREGGLPAVVAAVSTASNREARSILLPTGRLDVRVERAELPLDQLCGFAARRNPKRGFLFVSRVLGRHIPVPPSVMRDTHERLAAQVPADLPGPVLVIGMAETAIGLGHGVHEAYAGRTGRDDTIALHSTRYRLDAEPLLVFEEEHSHAPSHILYPPAAPELRARMERARSVVIVDDEASTGRTFVNLIRALRPVLPALERAMLVVITDWCGPEQRARMLGEVPLPATIGSLLDGTYSFEPAPNAHATSAPSAIGNGAPKSALLPRDFGRLGGVVGDARVRGLADGLFRAAGERLLVLGTGEFVHPPFLLARELERRGARVHFQATTRSPALVGHAMECALQFHDNYGDDIPNFIYNARREDYDRVLVCHETPSSTLDPALLGALGAEAVPF